MALYTVAGYASKWNIPVISPGSIGIPDKKNVHLYEYLTVVSDMQSQELSRFLRQIMIRFGWNKFYALYDKEGPCMSKLF